MRKIFILIIAMLFTTCLNAQSPQKLSYQAVIRNNLEELVTDHAVGMRISILQGSSSGTAVYVETQTPTSNSNGLITIEIGGGTIVSGTFSGIDWSTGTYFVKTETDPNGGTSYSITGTSQILSVPYAFFAERTRNEAAISVNVNELQQKVDDLENLIINQLPATDNGLVAYYPFNGNSNDESGNIINGTVNGAILTNDRFDFSDEAYAFDGTNDYIDLGNSSPINTTIDNSFTFSIWYKTSSMLEQRLFEKRDFGNKGFLVGTWGNQVGFWIGDGSAYITASSIKSFNQNVWNNFICVVDKSQKKVYSYLNGNLVNKVVDISSLNNSISVSQPARIGINVNLSGAFNGNIDDIRIYNRVLSQIEVQQLFNEDGHYTQAIVSDIDRNKYNTISIGTQVWMSENLRTRKYNNGDLIETTSSPLQDVSGETSPKYQWAYYGNEGDVTSYGRLYTWYAVTDARKICPTGWHVPTDADWNTLGSFLGGMSIAGGKLKEDGLSHWLTPNTGATNTSGFTALPAGSRQSNSFGYMGSGTYFWTVGELDAALGLHWRLSKDNAELQQSTGNKYQGYSIRCIKD